MKGLARFWLGSFVTKNKEIFSIICFIHIFILFIYWTKFSYKIGCSLNKINITAYFENLTVELHVLYALNAHVNFCVNRISFTM